MNPSSHHTARPFRHWAYVLSISILSAAPLHVAAQTPATDADPAADAVELGKVVITAAGYEQKVANAPASVTVVSREQLQSRPYAGLADALRDIEGIDVGSSLDKNGNISITLRGLPAEYTLVLIDGRRQSDIGDIGPNNFGNSQYMYMPPMEAIERIEVVRGPMSTLYGADAIGGVINIITRKVTDQWTGSIAHSLTLQEDSQYGDDTRTDFSLTGPLLPGRLGVGLRGSLFDREQTDPGYERGCLALPPEDVNGGTNPACYTDSGGFGDKKIVAARNWTLGATLNYTPSENHDIQFLYDIARQRYDNSDGQSGTLDSIESLWRVNNAGVIQPRVGYTPQQRVEREQFVLAHTGRWGFGVSNISLTRSRSANLGRSLPLSVEERQDVQAIWDAHCGAGNRTCVDTATGNPITADDVASELAAFLPRPLRPLEIRNTIVDANLQSQLDNHFLVIGGQYFDADLEDGVFGMDEGGYNAGVVQRHRQWALFAEDTWSLTPALNLTVGGRYDNHNSFGSHFSPRAYLAWTQGPNWTFKGGVSTGYKTPKPNDLYPGITGFGGQGVSPFVGTPGLEPETSTNYELAAYFDSGERYSANATIFFNRFKDKIVNQDNLPSCFDADGSPAGVTPCVDLGPGWSSLGYSSFRQKANVDSAETRGIELAGTVRFTPALILRGNYTYTDSEQTSGAEKGQPLVSTPEHMANAVLGWDATPALNLALTAEYRAKRYRTTMTTSGPQPVTRDLYYEPYTIVHLGARYRVSEALTVHARVNNLLDKDMAGRSCVLNGELDGYDCANSYNVTERARSLWLSANYRF